jgi:hypothetical protein
MTSGTVLAALAVGARESEAVPAMLDHILLGCRELAEGVAFVEARTGIRAGFGGTHPGRGTQNALLSLGERQYLEIIAPDPKQPGGQVTPMMRSDLIAHLHSLPAPRVIGWAAHPGELAAFARRLRDAGVAFTGPTAGSRMRPDGRLLQWQTVNLKDDDSGVLPFFIEWSADSPHPASDAPKGCRLGHFELVHPDPDELKISLEQLSLEVPVAKGPNRQIRASVTSPRGRTPVSL